jgi:hypothetical protein
MKKLTLRVASLLVGGFLIGNALWDVIKIDARVGVVVGVGLLLAGMWK